MLPGDRSTGRTLICNVPPGYLPVLVSFLFFLLNWWCVAGWWLYKTCCEQILLSVLFHLEHQKLEHVSSFSDFFHSWVFLSRASDPCCCCASSSLYSAILCVHPPNLDERGVQRILFLKCVLYELLSASWFGMCGHSSYSYDWRHRGNILISYYVLGLQSESSLL